MTSKERAELRTRAMKMESILQVGKSSLTPQLVDAIRAALKARELIKVNVLKNCNDDTASLANLLSERTGAEVVQVIGKKIVLYKKNPQKEEKKRLAQKREIKKKEDAKKKARKEKMERTGRTVPESRKPASGKVYRGSGVKKRNSRKQG